MIKFLYAFTVFLIGYFILYVTGNYYLQGVPYVSYIFPILKESLWFIFVLYNVWICHRNRSIYIKKTKLEMRLLIGIAVRGILATIILHPGDTAIMINILIGLKYGLYASIIFYTAAGVGYSSPLTQSDIINYTRYVCRTIVRGCAIGMVWQLCKWVFPQGFYTLLGYGPVGDYTVGHAHPIYYRTGPGGGPRLSGLMSGPNNLGYLLVAYASIIPLYVSSWWARIVYYLAIPLTVSRAAMIGSGVQGFTYLVRRYGNRYRALLIGGVVSMILIIGVISVMKSGSTLDHLLRTRGALLQVVDHPRGIGLGSSGPGVHRNGSVLPENFYLQLILDYGVIPFIAWCAFWLLVIRRSKQHLDSSLFGSTLRGFIAGFVGLLIVGLFLHVFEDSVVNYLFFIPFGLVRGHQLYLQNLDV